jgi:hypothetical protein
VAWRRAASLAWRAAGAWTNQTASCLLIRAEYNTGLNQRAAPFYCPMEYLLAAAADIPPCLSASGAQTSPERHNRKKPPATPPPEAAPLIPFTRPPQCHDARPRKEKGVLQTSSRDRIGFLPFLPSGSLGSHPSIPFCSCAPPPPHTATHQTPEDKGTTSKINDRSGAHGPSLSITSPPPQIIMGDLPA